MTLGGGRRVQVMYEGENHVLEIYQRKEFTQVVGWWEKDHSIKGPVPNMQAKVRSICHPTAAEGAGDKE